MGFDSRMRDITIGATTVVTIISLYVAWTIYKGNKPGGAVTVTE
jgi:hypothetical protein